MKRLLIIAAALVCATSAMADCNVYTSELDEPGTRTVTFADDGWVTIHDPQLGDRKYGTAGAGTGIPGRSMIPVDGDRGEELPYIEHKGDMIIANEVFEPYCK